VEAVPERVRAVVDGIELAASSRALRGLETAGAPVYYVAPADVRQEFLTATDRTTICEWKGEARYWTIALPGGRVIPNGGWSYPSPMPGYEAIAGHFAFYAWAVDEAWVGDELAMPQPGHFYGGWVTSRVVGPFKGGPGSFGW
jgi:uncharacterized protein (DUF427 family)